MDNISSKKGNNDYVAKWHYYAAKKALLCRYYARCSTYSIMLEIMLA